MRISRKKRACLALVLCCVAGCSSDTAYSLSRDYRTTSNECIDALMMVTSESRAKFANDKFLKGFSDRIGAIDKRAQNYEQNTDDKVVVLQMANTESVALLIAEMSINKTRFKREQERIKNLRDFLVNGEIERRKADGEANPIVKAADKWPNLNNIANGTSTAKLNDFYYTVNKGPSLLGLFGKFSTKGWKNALPKEGWEQMNDAFMETVKKFDKLE